MQCGRLRTKGHYSLIPIPLPFLNSSFVRIKTESSNGIDTKEVTASEAVKTEPKFKERSTPKITFRSSGEGNEVAFKKRKLNPDKKRNIRQTDPNKAS